jgi:uncharacterized protein with ParB-like and HNH nuclease domain
MKIQPLEKNIKSLIGDQSSYFSIPDYQRSYRWGEENINDFWNDIVTAYDNHEENYFLGSLILISRPSNNDFEVVDGQQRLTTIMIFLAVLRDHFAKNGKRDIAEKIQNEFIRKDGKYRLQVRPEDRSNFEDHILRDVSSLDGIENSSLGPTFINAIRFIRENIKQKENEVKDFTEYLNDLYSFFMDKTLVVSLIAEDLSSAYTIFETINHRGEELETDELLKNYLLKRLQEEVTKHNRQHPQAMKNFEEEKQMLLSGYKFIKGVAGENLKMQELLRHHWTAMTGTKPRKNLYKEIINYIKGQNISSDDFIKEWKWSGECYASLSKENDYYRSLSFQAKNNLKCLRLISHTEWIPALIATRRSKYGKEDFEKILALTERMYSLFWIAGYGATKVKNPTLTLIRDYLNKNRTIDEIKKFIDTILRKNRVVSRAQEAIVGECYGSPWCRLVLAKYEYSLTDGSIDKEIDFEKTQIEHILPQTMNDETWKNVFSEDEHEKMINTVGNLALLIGGVKEKNKSKNQSASNKSYEEKKSIYFGETLKDGVSAFQMVQDLKDYPEWNPKNLEDRGEKIISKIDQEWEITEDEKNQEMSTSRSDNGDTQREEDSEYSETDLKDLLIETLQRETPLTPRIIKFLEILLSESRPISRDEIKERLFDLGIGRDVGQSGHFLSNISQYITKNDNDHMRQIISFESDGSVGSLKDNYAIIGQYRDLVKDALDAVQS